MKAPRMTRILSFFLALVFCLYLVPTEVLAAELESASRISQSEYARDFIDEETPDVVSEIIAEVRKSGDAALKRYAEQFDGAAPAVFEVSEEERAAAYAQADAAFLEILKEAAAHIRVFHEKQKRTDFVLTEREGVVLGQKIIPLDRVGLYVPGRVHSPV